MQPKRLLLAAMTLAVLALFVEPVAAETAVTTYCPEPPWWPPWWPPYL